ncbi:unnamed protein product [Chilo suppressalis]|uniref:Uncharacterized protein n=1 Tax=Chilo suppressalis TaxID=168631 RepID=A0ABN8AWT9_CHISP|nr:unnamed protein product [Chilo suppressalis]
MTLEDIHETNSPQTSNQGNQRVLQVTPRFLYGKNKHKWSSVPRSVTIRTLRGNIVHFIPGPRGEARELQKPIDLRRDFVIKMGDQLMDPWLRERLQTVTLRHDIKVMLKDILGESSEPEYPVYSVTNVRKICYLCPSKARRMTKHRSIKCKMPFLDRTILTCIVAVQNNYLLLNVFHIS